MATGDLEGNLERLRVQLRTIGYPHPLDMNGLREGNPASILPLLHYALLGYSRHVARYLSENGYALFAKSDLRFVECMLKYLRGEHAYRCPLTVAQILSHGFAERKFLFVYDVIQVCKRKHSELVKQARQAQQARKTIKRNTTLRDIVKNIDAANLDSLHLDETLSMALEKVSQAQEHTNDIFTSDLNLEPSVDQKKDIELERQAQVRDLQNKFQQSINEKKETIVREIEMGSKVATQSKGSESCGNASKDTTIMEITCDVDASLSQCYEKLRTQIIEVAEKMERLLLTLKGDVQRITSDMQVKLTCLEKQTLYLGQSIPLRDFTGLKTPSSYNSLQLYYPHTIAIGGLNNPHEHLSTEKLIAIVKARCNKTKELLSNEEWIGPT